jgi:hypothetical protein
MIAIVTMIIDHMGLFFFPQFIFLRLIGRLAFPLFAWLIANGAYHTRDINKYGLRLYFFALLSEIPFLLPNRLIDPTFSDLNVLCTLFFGLCVIILIKKTSNRFYWVLFSAIFVFLAQVLQTDYGGFGVAVVIVFYLFFKNFRQMVFAQIIVFLVPVVVSSGGFGEVIESVGLLSLYFIRHYNNQLGIKAKYLFYIIYPMQYLVYYFLLLELFARSI